MNTEILSLWAEDSDAILREAVELVMERGDCPDGYCSAVGFQLTDEDVTAASERAEEFDDLRSALVFAIADRIEAAGLAEAAAEKKMEEECELAEEAAHDEKFAATVQELAKIPGFGGLSQQRRSQYRLTSRGVSFRVSDHNQKEGGGFLERSGYRAGDSHVSIVVTANQVLVEALGDYDREVRETARVKVASWPLVPTADELYAALRMAVDAIQ